MRSWIKWTASRPTPPPILDLQARRLHQETVSNSERNSSPSLHGVSSRNAPMTPNKCHDGTQDHRHQDQILGGAMVQWRLLKSPGRPLSAVYQDLWGRCACTHRQMTSPSLIGARSQSLNIDGMFPPVWAARFVSKRWGRAQTPRRKLPHQDCCRLAPSCWRKAASSPPPSSTAHRWPCPRKPGGRHPSHWPIARRTFSLPPCRRQAQQAASPGSTHAGRCSILSWVLGIPETTLWLFES